MLLALMVENIQMTISEIISDQMCRAALELRAEEQERQEQLKKQRLEQYIDQQRPQWALENERQKKEAEHKTAVARIQSQMVRARYACDWITHAGLSKQLEQLETEWRNYQTDWRIKRYGN